jgi:hypothetical protein
VIELQKLQPPGLGAGTDGPNEITDMIDFGDYISLNILNGDNIS